MKVNVSIADREVCGVVEIRVSGQHPSQAPLTLFYSCVIRKVLVVDRQLCLVVHQDSGSMSEQYESRPTESLEKLLLSPAATSASQQSDSPWIGLLPHTAVLLQMINF